jgi:hypothetical protein
MLQWESSAGALMPGAAQLKMLKIIWQRLLDSGKENSENFVPAGRDSELERLFDWDRNWRRHVPRVAAVRCPMAVVHGGRHAHVSK